MNEHCATAANVAGNPFSTCRIRPGAIPFVFVSCQQAESLVARLGENDWWGQIVGPHGSGKSALLATLSPALERAGLHVVHIELHDADRRLPGHLPFPLGNDGGERTGDGGEETLRTAKCKLQNANCKMVARPSGVLPAETQYETPPSALRRPPSMMVIVDGYEQLGWLSRWRLKRTCRRHGLGLLITTHVPAGLPELFHSAVDLPLAARLVEQLQRGYPPLITRDDLTPRFAQHNGNMRELLFALYDLYEQKQR